MNASRQVRTEPSPERSEWERFGTRVRQLRTRAGLSPDDLALREVCWPGLLERIESGEHAPARHLAHYLDRKIDTKGVLLDSWARALIQSHLDDGGPVEPLQSEARQIREFNPGVIPEFFQTEDYARALAEASRPLDASVPHAEAARAQQVRVPLYNTCAPPFYGMVLNESVLCEVVGNPEVMRAQLEHLARAVSRDHISLHVIPTGTRHHPCRSGPFRVLSFSPHHQVAYVPVPCGPGPLITDSTHTAAYADLFEALKGEALPRSATFDLLERIGDRAKSPQAITAGPEPVLVSDRIGDGAVHATH